MEAALKQFDIDVTGLTCLDAGLSTGGFTDCLLQKGAVKVYGVDVGAGQVMPMLDRHKAAFGSYSSVVLHHKQYLRRSLSCILESAQAGSLPACCMLFKFVASPIQLSNSAHVMAVFARFAGGRTASTRPQGGNH